MTQTIAPENLNGAKPMDLRRRPYRDIKAYGKKVTEIRTGGGTDNFIRDFKLEDGTILSRIEMANAIHDDCTEGLYIVQGSTTDDWVIKSPREYSRVPLSALPHFY